MQPVLYTPSHPAISPYFASHAPGTQNSQAYGETLPARREEAGRPRGFREADRHAAVLWAASRTEENLFLCSSFSQFWWAGWAEWAGVLISVLRLPSPLLPHSLSFLPFSCFILVILASRVHRTFRKLRMLFLPFFFLPSLLCHFRLCLSCLVLIVQLSRLSLFSF